MTKIIKKIDSLGRIVIPKNIRENLELNENDNVEMYLMNNELHIRKHVTQREITDLFFLLKEYSNQLSPQDQIKFNLLYNKIEKLFDKAD